MIIDAHQHYWKLARGDYGWLTPEAGPVLYRDYEPAELKVELARSGVVGTIAVQAAPTIEETEYLLELAERDGTLLGVVGWMDLDAADFERQYARLRANGRFVGIRPNLPDVNGESDWSEYPRLLNHLSLLAEDGFPVELLIGPEALPAMEKLLARIPNLTAIVDHLANPAIENGAFERWAEGMRALAAYERTACKLSGFAKGSDGRLRKSAAIAPYARHVLEAFGAERLLFGSDWPVCLQSVSYDGALALALEVVPASLPAVQIEAIFGGNALRIYKPSGISS